MTELVSLRIDLSSISYFDRKMFAFRFKGATLDRYMSQYLGTRFERSYLISGLRKALKVLCYIIGLTAMSFANHSISSSERTSRLSRLCEHEYGTPHDFMDCPDARALCSEHQKWSVKNLRFHFGSFERAFHLRAAANTQRQRLHFSCCDQRPIPFGRTLLSFLLLILSRDCLIKCDRFS